MIIDEVAPTCGVSGIIALPGVHAIFNRLIGTIDGSKLECNDVPTEERTDHSRSLNQPRPGYSCVTSFRVRHLASSPRRWIFRYTVVRETLNSAASLSACLRVLASVV